MSKDDKARRNALRKRIERANKSLEEKARCLKRKRDKWAHMKSEDKAQCLKRMRDFSRDNWTNMDSEDKAQCLKRMRDFSRDNWTNMDKEDRAKRNMRRRKNYADIDLVAKAKELKRKAEIEALRRAGFTRQEHERVMQQQRDAYYKKMSEMDSEAKAQLYERVTLRRRQQIGKTCGPDFGVSVASLTVRLILLVGLPTGMQCNIDLFEPHKCDYFSVGTMTYQCDFCQALGFDKENRSDKVGERHYGILCCNQQAVVLDSIPTPPANMLSLWTNTSQEARFFRNNIRAINAQLNFGSLQVTEKTVRGTGPASFKVCGVLNRRVGSIMARDGCREPKCIQTYFYDNHSQDVTRAQRLASIETGSISERAQAAHLKKHQMYLSIFAKLRYFLVESCNNRYIQAFKTIKEYVDEQGKRLFCANFKLR